MKSIGSNHLIQFELVVMEFAETCGIKKKDDLERLSDTLHEHLEIAMQDYAMDEGIENYEPQY